MRIGIIGAGKVGQALGKSLQAAGETFVGLTAGSKASAAAAAAVLKTEAFNTNAGLVPLCDVVFLTVPDRQIGTAAESLARYFAKYGNRALEGKTFFHCSGSMGLEELSPLAEIGAGIGSLHPLQSFANPGVSFRGIYIALDGTDEVRKTGIKLARRLQAHAFSVPAEERKAYHAAACFASNYVVTVMSVAQELMARWTPTPADGLSALLPLFCGTANNLKNTQLAREALTGPIARGDINTIEAHLAVIPPEIAELYKALGEKTVLIAELNGTIESSQAKAMLEVLRKQKNTL